jgi:putative flippase GtrA
VNSARVSRFAIVGLAGFAVQMTVGAALLAAGLLPLLATLVAIEAAIVTNHVWHRRWAWRDRAEDRPWALTLARAHIGSGGVSLVVGMGTVIALSGHVPALAAQVIAIGLCATANYWLADRWVFGEGRTWCLLLTVVALSLSTPAAASAAGPSPQALQSWDRYVAALDAARAADRVRHVPSWATDEDPQGTRVRSALGRGEIDVTRRELPDVAVDGATLEHWQGSVLVRGVSMEQIVERLRHPERFPQPRDVLSLEVTNWSESGHELYLRLTRSMLVTATYDTWYRVRHQLHGPARVDSIAIATRIEEISDPGTSNEKRIPADDSRGFLWRMQSRWRFSVVPEGIVVTCESITLSRPVPLGLGVISRPIVTRVARESMTTALRAWQNGWKETPR